MRKKEPTQSEQDDLYLRCWRVRHPTTRKKYLTDGRLVFANSNPFDIKFILGEDNEFIPIEEVVK